MTCLIAILLLAGQSQPSAGDVKLKVLDLVFKVQDLETKVESLQVKETDTELRIDLAADVLFDFDKANILPKAEPVLNQVAEIVRQRGKGTIRIEGHTDGKGTDAYNERLSRQRADAVKTWLQKRGKPPSGLRFATAGFGARRPVAPNTKPDGSDDPDGRRKNRRVEIVWSKN